jgi:hypothetical protein
MTTWTKIALVASAVLATPATGLADDKILSFDTMAGVVRPFTGATNPIRGVRGGGVPWTLNEAKGELRTDGQIRVRVRGLVVASTGTNPSPQFRAIVSCLTTAVDANGAPLAVNLPTNAFPASPEGDSEIEDVVILPSPCIAPIVFVTNPGGAWFAATGF